jgi:ubiquitin-conjugating enzyme E2 O
MYLFCNNLSTCTGLILNREPYFNEAGYETRRGYAESIEKSRRYNEMALIRSIDNLVQIVQHPPALFATEIRRHVNERIDG